MVEAQPLQRRQRRAPGLDLGRDAERREQLGALRWLQIEPVAEQPVGESFGIAAAGVIVIMPALSIATVRPSINA